MRGVSLCDIRVCVCARVCVCSFVFKSLCGGRFLFGVCVCVCVCVEGEGDVDGQGCTLVLANFFLQI